MRPGPLFYLVTAFDVLIVATLALRTNCGTPFALWTSRHYITKLMRKRFHDRFRHV